MKVRIFSESNRELNGIGECLVRAFSEHLDGKTLKAHMLPDTNGELDITMVVNGEEFPFQEIMNVFDRNISFMVDNRAKELVKEKFVDVDDLIDELREEIKIRCKKVFPNAYYNEYE